MNFEDRLLAELKAEVAGRASREPARSPRRIGRRLLAGAAVVAIAAAAAVVIPVVTGSQAPAYAVTRNADGSISVLIHELRDPDRLEADLARLGVHVDISYHTSDLDCPGGRLPPASR